MPLLVVIIILFYKKSKISLKICKKTFKIVEKIFHYKGVPKGYMIRIDKNDVILFIFNANYLSFRPCIGYYHYFIM